MCISIIQRPHCPAPELVEPPFTEEEPMLSDIGGRSGVRVGTLYSRTPPSSLESCVRRRGREEGASLSSTSPIPTGNPSPAIIGSNTKGGVRGREVREAVPQGAKEEVPTCKAPASLTTQDTGRRLRPGWGQWFAEGLRERGWQGWKETLRPLTL